MRRPGRRGRLGDTLLAEAYIALTNHHWTKRRWRRGTARRAVGRRRRRRQEPEIADRPTRFIDGDYGGNKGWRNVITTLRNAALADFYYRTENATLLREEVKFYVISS